MKNGVQDGLAISVIATEDMLSGKVYLVGSLRGVASFDALTGEECSLVTDGVFSVTKTAANVVAQGAKLYLNTTSGEVTTTASGNYACGVATVAAGNGDANVNLKLIQDLSGAA